ncbi:hypothetical protein CAC42_4523 [Sphaceloma murrayae]|uniref:Uncharacterized protein n=1 Tax=Sphaceloma murrayae TaxID=2082308 RepID=A0A2K1QME8_9PEZI|nr:hypothetical protein CAC42_4523 [Sphaceloma murrayae]
MSSVQANLARVRAHLDTTDHEERFHGAILDAYEDAMREHEASVTRDEEKSRGPTAGRERRPGKGEGRFRFKSKGGERGRRRGKERGTGGDDGERVERFAAHPLPRPEGAEGWLDPSEETVEGLAGTKKRKRCGSERSEMRGPSSDGEALDPDEAFKSSLFDALADDEGAASYWEGVYSQPLHVFPRPKVQKEQDGARDAGEYPLEEMDDEEYVQYVKRRMWEKANPHLVREMRIREERDRENRGRKERRRRGERSPSRSNGAGSSRSGFMDDVEAALARGERRRADRLRGLKERERWERAWEKYVRAWKAVEERKDGDAIAEIPWLVETRNMEDALVVEKVQAFLEAIMDWVLPKQSDGRQDVKEVDNKLKIALLKAERFRWHPDKMQHRFGGREAIGDKALEAVTGVFQVIDKLLEQERRRV